MTNAEAGDAQFGRAALDKQEEADRLLAEGQDPTTAPEGEGVDPRPTAGGKASEGAPSAAERESGQADEESRDSFPASDPPANY